MTFSSTLVMDPNDPHDAIWYLPPHINAPRDLPSNVTPSLLLDGREIDRPSSSSETCCRVFRETLRARTDKGRAVLASCLFVIYFCAVLVSPIERASVSTCLSLCGLVTWCMMMAVEWDGPSYLYGPEAGKLPGSLLGCLSGYGVLVVLRMIAHTVMVCLTWRGEAGAYYSQWPRYSIRLFALAFATLGIWLIVDCARKIGSAPKVRQDEAERPPPRYSASISSSRPTAFQPGLLSLSQSAVALPPYSRPTSPPPYSA